MKKILTILAVLASAFTLSAQTKGLEANFTLTKTSAAKSATETATGKIYYAEPGSLALHYAAPSKNLMIIAGTAVYSRQGDKERHFDTTKNAPMRSMASTLINCVKGETKKVAEENDADIVVKDFARTKDVTITARKKAARGYSQIKLSYNRSNGQLIYMKLIEFGGTVSEYKMTGFRSGVTLPKDAFAIPAKKNASAK